MKYFNKKVRNNLFLFVMVFMGQHMYSQSLQPPQTGTADITNNCMTSVTLSVHSYNAPTGVIHKWYTSQTGTQTIPHGVSQGTPNNVHATFVTIYTSRTYWVSAELNGMESSRTRVSATFIAADTTPPSLILYYGGDRCGPSANFVLRASGGSLGSTYEWYESSNTSGTPIYTGRDYMPTLNASKTFWVKATMTGGNCFNGTVTETKTITATVLPEVMPAIGYNTGLCFNPGPLTISAVPGQNGNTIRWYNESGAYLGIGPDYTIANFSSTQTFYAESYNSATRCASSTRLPIVATFYEQKTWYLDADGDGHAISVNNQCWNPPPSSGWTDTVLPLDDCDDTDPLLTLDCDVPIIPIPNPVAGNYIYSRNYQGATSQPYIDYFQAHDSIIQTIAYFDGLGRGVQSIGIDHSPLGNDIINHMGYDQYGREDKSYLPYSTGQGGLGSYRTDDETSTLRYYNVEKYQFTVNPFSDTRFEPSALNRPVKQGAPGNDWAVQESGDDHAVEFEYFMNIASDNVRHFRVATTLTGNTFNPTLIFDSNPSGIEEYYSEGELYKQITYDENHTTGNNHSAEEFTNRSGQVVLRRTYDSPDNSSDSNARHDTYYVYDDFGSLTYVLSPKMNGSTASLISIQNAMDALGYQYIYDHRNRLVEKKIPGKGKEYIVYNQLNQPILTQDANQHHKTPEQEWLFTKYDVLGRVAYTGKASDNRDRATIQQEVDNLAAGALWVEQQNTASSFGGTSLYYDNEAYPTTTTGTLLTEILTINYYDTYVDRPQEAPASVSVMGTPSTPNTADIHGMATGSRIKVLDVSPAKWINSVTYYDDKARPIYSYSINEYLETIDIMEYRLDFVGRTLKSRSTHSRNGETIVTLSNYTYDHIGRLKGHTQCIGDETLRTSCQGGDGTNYPSNIPLTGTIDASHIASVSITVTEASIVDGAYLRVIENTTGSSAPEELITWNEYDELGRLDSKKVGGDPAGNLSNSTGLQIINYSYNVRDWLTGINNNELTNNALTIDADDLFGFRIDYNTSAGGATPLYNGNISRTQWRSQNQDTDLRSYTYGYDALNRISTATDNAENYNLQNVTYDKNGNILTLDRKGHTNAAATTFDLMDNLDYNYGPVPGNKLLSVTDGINGTAAKGGFDDGNKTGDDYDYDTNGNMTMDRNKGIETNGIAYNYLNLPTEISINGNGNLGTITYIYAADGTKIQKIVSNDGQGSLTTTDYCGSFIYERIGSGTPQLKFFSHPEGYIESDTQGNYDYIYQYKDHLRNIRLSYSDDNENGSITSSEIREENHYYPFGLKHLGYNNIQNGTEFNFKEFQEQEFTADLGLDTHEWRYRVSDPSIGRFWQIDPLTEDYEWMTTYQFASNQPIHGPELEGLENPVDLSIHSRGERGRAADKYIKENPGTAAAIGIGLFVAPAALVVAPEFIGSALIFAAQPQNQILATEGAAFTSALLMGDAFPEGIFPQTSSDELGKSLRYLFRGTTKGWKGGSSALRAGATPTSSNPAVATAYSIFNSTQHGGEAIVEIGVADEFVEFILGNGVLTQDREVVLDLLPEIFSGKSFNIPAGEARRILEEMGIHIPSKIRGTSNRLDQFVKELPDLTPEQLQQFYSRAIKIQQ